MINLNINDWLQHFLCNGCFFLVFLFLILDSSLPVWFPGGKGKNCVHSNRTGGSGSVCSERSNRSQAAELCAGQGCHLRSIAATTPPFPLPVHVITPLCLLTLLGVGSGGIWTLGRLAPPLVEVDPKQGGFAAWRGVPGRWRSGSAFWREGDPLIRGFATWVPVPDGSPPPGVQWVHFHLRFKVPL